MQLLHHVLLEAAGWREPVKQISERLKEVVHAELNAVTMLSVFTGAIQRSHHAPDYVVGRCHRVTDTSLHNSAFLW